MPRVIRATNANAESFNAKVKAFRAQFRGSNGYSFLPLQAYEIMCMRREEMQLGFTTDPQFSAYAMSITPIINQKCQNRDDSDIFYLEISEVPSRIELLYTVLQTVT